MGIFARIFGSSDRKDDVVGDRCNDCGMAGGTHTEWCPSAGAVDDRSGSAPPSGAGDPAGESGEQPPHEA